MEIEDCRELIVSVKEVTAVFKLLMIVESRDILLTGVPLEHIIIHIIALTKLIKGWVADARTSSMKPALTIILTKNCFVTNAVIICFQN